MNLERCLLNADLERKRMDGAWKGLKPLVYLSTSLHLTMGATISVGLVTSTGIVVRVTPGRAFFAVGIEDEDAVCV